MNTNENVTQEADFYLSISKEQLSKLPQEHYTGPIRLIEKEEDVADAVAELRMAGLIGFDTETRPSFKRGSHYNVALMQLSAKEKGYLFRLNKIGFPEQLRLLLEDRNVMKIGASIHDDFHNLNRIKPFEPDGFLDIQQYVKQFRIADNSLARIYGIIFGKRLSKAQRLTNWELPTLTVNQQVYAALDAVACTRIYEYLESGQFDLKQSEYKCVPHVKEEEPSEKNPGETDGLIAEKKPQEPVKSQEPIVSESQKKLSASAKRRKRRKLAAARKKAIEQTSAPLSDNQEHNPVSHHESQE